MTLLPRSATVLRGAALLFACIAAYAAIRSFALALAIGASGQASIPPPADARLVLRNALAVRADPARLLLAARAARTLDPLNDAPFLLRGQAALLRGDLASARSNFMRARAMDPRATAGRVGLIETLIRSGDGAGALAQTFALLRLRDDLEGPVMPALLRVALEPHGREALVEASRRQPEIAARLLARASAMPGQEQLTAGLLSLPVTQRDRFAAITAIAARGNYRLAYRLWTGRTQAPDHLVDDFTVRAAPEPFGWTALRDSNATATIGEGGSGLAVAITGTLPVAAAQQVLLLPAGRYLLEIEAQRVSGGTFEWRLSCADGDDAVAESPALDRAGRVRVAFTLEPACAVQKLVVSGAAALPDDTAQARFRRLTIRTRWP